MMWKRSDVTDGWEAEVGGKYVTAHLKGGQDCHCQVCQASTPHALVIYLEGYYWFELVFGKSGTYLETNLDAPEAIQQQETGFEAMAREAIAETLEGMFRGTPHNTPLRLEPLPQPKTKIHTLPHLYGDIDKGNGDGV